MFSKLLKTARGLLSEPEARPLAIETTPVDEGNVVPSTAHSKEPAEEIKVKNSPAFVEKTVQKKSIKGPPPPNEDPLEEELTEENTINVYVPTPTASSRRRKRGRNEAFTMSSQDGGATPSVKKRKVLPVRAKDTKSPKITNSYPVVEIPAKKIILEPKTRLDTPAKKVEIAATDDEEEDVSPIKFFTPKEPSPKKHKRFGSEDLEEEFFSTALEPAKVDHKDIGREESEESDDEAPEAVGVQEAANSIKSKDQKAAKAVKEQLSSTREKRKQKDEVLKKQAASAKKRKLEAVREEEVTVSSTKGPKITETLGEGNDTTKPEDEQDQAAEEGAETKAPASKLISFGSRSGLPDLLPEEYLEDDVSGEDMVLVEEKPKKKPKKKSFMEAEKAPRDRRVGSTTYRVTKATSTTLAPKVTTRARSVKEQWMQGRTGTKNPNRRVASKGFFKK